jgi:UPF0271 protein
VRAIDLNADMGEGFGPWRMGDDAVLLGIVSSASIACGFHAGDPAVMATTTAAAAERGVRIGAHPGFPDLAGFGRRRMQMGAAELAAALHYQLGALQGIAGVRGARMAYVKPHGALNNMACEDADLARTVARAVRDFGHGLALMAPSLSELARAGEDAGLDVIHEVFADRAYTAAGTLVPRGTPGAVIADPAAALAHVLGMVEAQALLPASGERLACRIDSVCVHGDGPEAIRIARAVRAGLEEAGWTVSANAGGQPRPQKA